MPEKSRPLRAIAAVLDSASTVTSVMIETFIVIAFLVVDGDFKSHCKDYVALKGYVSWPALNQP